MRKNLPALVAFFSFVIAKTPHSLFNRMKNKSLGMLQLRRNPIGISPFVLAFFFLSNPSFAQIQVTSIPGDCMDVGSVLLPEIGVLDGRPLYECTNCINIESSPFNILTGLRAYWDPGGAWIIEAFNVFGLTNIYYISIQDTPTPPCSFNSEWFVIDFFDPCPVTISGPSCDRPFPITFTSTDETCNGMDGTAAVSATGGSGAFTYLWDTGNTTSSISGLSSGAYSVTVTDAAGDEASDMVTVGQNIVDLNVTTTASNSLCNVSTGSLTATISNSTGPFTYAWSNGATTATISGLPPGTYSVTVTDANGCTSDIASTEVDITDGIEEPILTTAVSVGEGDLYN